jgi:hypothetical protein
VHLCTFLAEFAAHGHHLPADAAARVAALKAELDEMVAGLYEKAEASG